MKEHIVKIQMPVMSSESDPSALLYNKSRSFEVQIPASQLKSKMKDSYKKFFYVKFKKPSGFTLLEEAPWQDW